MIPQPILSVSTNGGPDDIFARTQQIMEAAMAVQRTAEQQKAPLLNLSFPAPQLTNQSTSLYDMQSASMPTNNGGNSYSIHQPRHYQGFAPAKSMQQKQLSIKSVNKQLWSLQTPGAADFLNAPSRFAATRRVSLDTFSKRISKSTAKATASTGKRKITMTAKAAQIAEAKENSEPARKRAKKTTAAKKKKSTKKDTKETTAEGDDKPRRPLSAYNLFFRHERATILMAEAADPDNFDLNMTTFCVDTVDVNRKPRTSKASRKKAVQSVLNDNPFHQDRKKRAHRKSHGKIGFTDLVKLIAGRWKKANAETKSLYDELAEDEKTRYQTEFAVWKAAQPAISLEEEVEKQAEEAQAKDGSKSKKAAKKGKKRPLKAEVVPATTTACDFPEMPALPAVSPQKVEDDDFSDLLSSSAISDDDLSAAFDGEGFFDDMPMPPHDGGQHHHAEKMVAMGGVDAFALDNNTFDFLCEFD